YLSLGKGKNIIVKIYQ
ncbi:hypothetical protein BN1723_018316, partial [Verticillium longisporum]